MKMKFVLAAAILSLSTNSAFAVVGIIDEEWTNGSLKYCSYSNGVIITIKSYKLCPVTIR